MIAVVDYGRGNLGSVEKAFARVGIPARVTADPRVVDEAEACVLPGDALGLGGALRRALDGRRPFFGICLGYQLLFTESEEFGHTKGLDVVGGVVRRLPRGLKVPHMGWNQVGHDGRIPLFDGIPSGAHFYFVHSYYPDVSDGSVAVATCEYGITFTAALARDNVFGTQFHPEKSQRWGLRMLENFAALVKGARA